MTAHCLPIRIPPSFLYKQIASNELKKRRNFWLIREISSFFFIHLNKANINVLKIDHTP